LIYLDTSVALAHVLAEDRGPPPELWAEELVSSRLLEYEVWTRVHSRDLAKSHGDVVRLTLARLAWVEMHPDVLRRATLPFPVRVRTLDALHLASLTFLLERGYDVALATYDVRLAGAAAAMDLPVAAV
jgi:hypothetical protein